MKCWASRTRLDPVGISVRDSRFCVGRYVMTSHDIRDNTGVGNSMLIDFRSAEKYDPDTSRVVKSMIFVHRPDNMVLWLVASDSPSLYYRDSQ